MKFIPQLMIIAERAQSVFFGDTLISTSNDWEFVVTTSKFTETDAIILVKGSDIIFKLKATFEDSIISTMAILSNFFVPVLTENIREL